MRLLITGAFGFLGGRLSQYLAQAGYEVVLGTRKSISAPAWLSNVRVVQTRWDSIADLEAICIDVDAVIHLAGMNAQECMEDPAAALELNGVATTRLLQAAIRQKAKRFIYFSTAHVYGSPLTGIIAESLCPTSLHPYATSHRAGEDVVMAAHQNGKIEGLVIRLSNTYGAPAHAEANCWMLLVNDLCRQAVATGRMVLKSSGMQRRDFLPLSDVNRAINHLVQLPAQNIGKGLFNVGSGWSPTVWEMACLIQERCSVVLGFRPELTRVSPRPDEQVDELDYRLDLLRQSGYKPATDKTGEIDRLLEFCKSAFS